MTNKEVLKKMFGIDFDTSNLTLTCSMLECSKCPYKYADDCRPYEDPDITREWLKAEWR